MKANVVMMPARPAGDVAKLKSQRRGARQRVTHLQTRAAELIEFLEEELTPPRNAKKRKRLERLIQRLWNLC